MVVNKRNYSGAYNDTGAKGVSRVTIERSEP